ncbi:hypothetical protein AGMMS50229_08730 [Campylobacterota bacterium]|nr:hypothetical protein AGMMS50229_08730 [Campylobacterota bacterium]
MKMTVFAFFALILTFFGCAKPQVELSRAVTASIKTPTMALSQSGFINALPNDAYQLQTYAAGSGTMELTVSDRVCQGMLCLSAESFNSRYLSRYYPPNLLRDILGERTIAGLENSAIETAKNGFTQRAEAADKYAIVYTKNGGELRFSDRLNRITIVIRDAN